jgi:O-antigen/teichoic acid export membrane protein
MLAWSAGMAYTAITIVIGFVTTPLLLRWLGDERLGALRASSDWGGQLALLDLGVGSAVGVLLLRARLDPTQAHPAMVLRSGMRLLTRLAVPMVLVGIPLALAMPRLVKVPESLESELVWSSLIGLAGIALLPLAVCRAHLEVTQQGYRVHLALIVQSLVVTTTALLLAWSGAGLVGQAAALLLGLVVFSGMTFWWARKAVLAKLPGDGELLGLRSFWPTSWPLAASGLILRIGGMAETALVALTLGAAPVTTLFLTQRLVLLASSQVNAVANATWAAMAELRSESTTRYIGRLGQLVRVIVGGGLVLTGTVAAFNERFVALWVGPSFYAGGVATLLTLAIATLFGFVLIMRFLIDAEGHTRDRLVSGVVGGIVTLVLGGLLAGPLGLEGILLAKLLGFCVGDAVYCPWLMQRRYGVRARSIAAQFARGVAVGVPWLAFAWWVARAVPRDNTWLTLLIELSATGAAALLYLAVVLLTQPERVNIWRRLRRAGSARGKEHPA